MDGGMRGGGEGRGGGVSVSSVYVCSRFSATEDEFHDPMATAFRVKLVIDLCLPRL